ncbi:GDSL esterase/lipase At5g14450-like [Punica granatum]|uniref:GDSL esterase/lipase At5g14450-like n=1 Tax=Punica granatum TaxID=22663 RepID=A0A6P8CF42_PUNGR|nr:GDSL esterase/lipase At5g14450-like [Punica granatum]
MVKVEGGSVGGVLAMLPLLVIVGVLHDVAAVEATPSRCDFPAIYNFGDSNSDTGGISAAFYQMAAPDGETYFHRPAGRASDGRLIIDFIAEHLGLPHLSAYLDSLGTSYQHGANFATGGATIRRQNESWFLNGVSPFSLDIQMAQFDQFKNRSAYLYGSLRVRYRAECILRTMLSSFSVCVFFCQHLYDQGARTFWIHNTGPIGCLAITIQAVHDPMPGYLDKQGCVKDQNDMASEFNRQLKEKVGQLRRQLPEAALTYIDVYSAKYGLIGAAKEQGKETKKDFYETSIS